MALELSIPVGVVGARSKPRSVSLSPRQTMNFAAALDDGNPRYFNDERPEGIQVPPMLAVALTWPLSASFDTYWGDMGFPAEARLRQVHYNESLWWRRTICCDEDLTIQGEVQALRPHPSGTLIALRYDAVDRGGAPVFTEVITGLLRGVGIEGGGEGAGELPDAAGTNFDTGESNTGSAVWELPIPVAPRAAHLYDACTDIVFPIHTSIAFARQAGLPGPIYQGTATLGCALRELLNREASGEPARLAEVHCGFRGMVFPGTTVLLRVRGAREEPGTRTIFFEVETPAGTMAIREGRAVFRAPQ